MKKLLSTILLLFSLQNPVSAHPGKLDLQGGHYDSRTGEYHYHRAPSARPNRNEAIRSNILHSVTVIRVVDGNTIDVMFENGTQPERVRLIGVHTPEVVNPDRPARFYGKEASDFTTAMLIDREVWLQFDVTARDRYRRFLAYIWLERPGDINDEEDVRQNMFNARLILGGYGQAVTIQPNSRYARLFAQFQREAQEESRGLWFPYH